jgi:hypothetical protein
VAFPGRPAQQTIAGPRSQGEFRTIITDSVALTLICKGSLTAKDFLVWSKARQLTEEGYRRFFQA